MGRCLSVLCVGVLAAVCSRQVCRAQDLPAVPEPVAIDSGPDQPPPVQQAPPAPLVPPPLPVFQPPPAEPAPEFPILDAKFAPPPGWFAGVEVSLFSPRVRLEHPSQVDLDLDWTASPWVYLGYRFCNGGAVRLAYRNLASDGSTSLVIPDVGEQDLKSRLDVNRIDLDYVSREYAASTHWRLQWELGARLANRFQDEWGQDPTGSAHLASNFFGAGPHAGLSAAWLFGDSGWAWFARVDGAVLFGSDRWHGTVEPNDPFFLPFGFTRRRSETETDGMFETGVSWTMCTGKHWLRLAGGVQVDSWSTSRNEDSNNLFPFREVTSVGPFFRCELGF